MTVFTDKFIRGLKPGRARYEERDGGCPGLCLRVGVRGEKLWTVVVPAGGARRRIRLGTYPDISLASARRLAAERRSAPQLHSAGLRLEDLWDIYQAEMRPLRRAFHDVEMVWQLWAEPLLGRVRLEDVTLRHGAELIDRVTRRSSPNRARAVIRYLSPMLSFAAGRGLLPGNPWAGLHLPEGVARRDRVLTRTEWAAIAAWARAAPYPWSGFVLVLMLSGQRLSEVAEMRWAEIEGEIWTIPAERMKSKRRHEVPLSAALADVIGAQPHHDAFVFSTRPGRPVVPGGKLLARVQSATGTGRWRWHDVRRTAATFMAEGGVHRFTIERVLGHADSSVTAVYDRADYRDEKRRALEVLAATVGGGDG